MKSNRHAPQFQFRVTDMKRRFFTKNLRWLKNFVRIFYELSCNSSKIVFDFQEPLWLRIFCCISHSNYSKDAARWMNNITGFTKKTWKIAQRWSCLSQRTISALSFWWSLIALPLKWNDRSVNILVCGFYTSGLAVLFF